MRVAGPGMSGSERAQVDDAALSGAQVGKSFAGDQEGTAGVGVED